MAETRASFALAGKSFIVTGGRRGIGLALTKSLLAEGSSVGVIDLATDPGDDLQAIDKHYPGRCHYASGNVAHPSSLQNAFTSLVERMGQLDGCVTAAGICIDKAFEQHSWEDLQRQFSVNTAGTFFAVQLTVKHLRENGRAGSIVMIASQAARHICPGHFLSGYASSKGAVLSFARNLAVELAATGIRVNSISAGYIASEMNLSIARDRPELYEIFQTAPPLGRMGSVDDLKGGLLYLLSDLASYVTGVDLAIDGGMCVSASSGKVAI